MGHLHLEKNILQKKYLPVGSTARLRSLRFFCAATRPTVANASIPSEDPNFISSKDKRQEISLKKPGRWEAGPSLPPGGICFYLSARNNPTGGSRKEDRSKGKERKTKTDKREGRDPGQL